MYLNSIYRNLEQHEAIIIKFLFDFFFQRTIFHRTQMHSSRVESTICRKDCWCCQIYSKPWTKYSRWVYWFCLLKLRKILIVKCYLYHTAFYCYNLNCVVLKIHQISKKWVHENLECINLKVFLEKIAKFSKWNRNYDNFWN